MINRDIRRIAEIGDYEKTEFRDLNIWLPELFRVNLQRTRQGALRDMTFTNCMLEGPAVLVTLGGVRFEGCNLGDAKGDIRSLLLRPLSSTTVVGAIALQNCRVVDSDFYAVGFTGGEGFLQELLQIPTPAPAEAPA